MQAWNARQDAHKGRNSRPIGSKGKVDGAEKKHAKLAHLLPQSHPIVRDTPLRHRRKQPKYKKLCPLLFIRKTRYGHIPSVLALEAEPN